MTLYEIKRFRKLTTESFGGDSLSKDDLIWQQKMMKKYPLAAKVISHNARTLIKSRLNPKGNWQYMDEEDLDLIDNSPVSETDK